jgi:hypothetical protein
LARRLQQNAKMMRARTIIPPTTPPTIAGIDLFEPPELGFTVPVGVEVPAAPRSVTVDDLAAVVDDCVDVLLDDVLIDDVVRDDVVGEA